MSGPPRRPCCCTTGRPLSRRQFLFDFADAEGMTLFGTSAKYIDAATSRPCPRDAMISAPRTMTSTGSPLVEGFDYVYTQVKEDLCLASTPAPTLCPVSCSAIRWAGVARRDPKRSRRRLRYGTTRAGRWSAKRRISVRAVSVDADHVLNDDGANITPPISPNSPVRAMAIMSN